VKRPSLPTLILALAAICGSTSQLFASGARESGAPPPPAGSSAGPSADGRSSLRAVDKLRIGVLSDVDSIPLFIARDHGFFARDNADVELIEFKSPVTRDAALQAGEIDGAISDVLAAVFARQAGFKVRITSATNGSYKLVVNPHSAVNNLAGLEGKSVGISQNTIIEYCTDRMFEAANLSVALVRKLPVSQMPVRLEMLQQGKLDAAVLPEPLASVAVAAGGRTLDSSDRLGINPGVIIFREQSISARSAQIRNFYAAYNDAVSYLEATPPDRYIDALVVSASFPSQARQSLVLPRYELAAVPREKEVTEVTAWLHAKGLASRVYPYGELVDGSVLP